MYAEFRLDSFAKSFFFREAGMLTSSRAYRQTRLDALVVLSFLKGTTRLQAGVALSRRAVIRAWFQAGVVLSRRAYGQTSLKGTARLQAGVF